MFNRNIAIDKDDTLNYLTLDICKDAGIDEIPTLDVIKAGTASKAFYEARKTFFDEPSNFSNEPYGLANSIIEIAKEHNFNPLICTKTMSGHSRGDEIIAHKFKFLRQYYPDVEAMIVMGRKFPDALGLIDDSLANCLFFNDTAERPFLVWNHQTSSIKILHSFYAYVQDFFETVQSDKIEKGNKRGIALLNDENGKPFLSSLEGLDFSIFTLVGSYLGSNPVQFNDYYVDNKLWDFSPEEREVLWNQFKEDYSLEIGTNEMIDVLTYNSENAIRSFSKP